MIALATAVFSFALSQTPIQPPLVAPTMAAGLQNFSGRGVYYASSVARCPIASPDARAPHGCLRVALDDEHSSVQIDPEKHRIVFRNAFHYADKQTVGDILLPGWSTLGEGRVPSLVHFVIKKKGDKLEGKAHAHAVSRETPKVVEVEPYDLVLDDGTHQTDGLSVEAAKKVLTDPGLAAKLAGELVEVTDNLPADAKSAVAGQRQPVGDVTIALGVGPLAKKVMRAKLFKDGADLELELSALSGLVPKAVLQRDLFLYGLESLPLLAPLPKRGLKSGDTLVFRAQAGAGTLEFGGSSAPFPNAADAARAFLEGSFVGTLLAHQAHLDQAN